jgi:phage gpG-like protein
VTGARLTATLDDKQFQRAVTQLGGVLHTGVLAAIGVALVEEVNKRFETGKDVWGVAWQPLLPAYAAIKKGNGILRGKAMNGGLQSSLTYDVSGSTIRVGATKIYAAVHQFGAVIKAKNAPYLAFQLGAAGPKGGMRRAFVHVQSVRIPQRPYLGFGPNDQRAVMEVLDVFVGRLLRT